MNEKQYKKFIRKFFLLWLLSLISIIATIFYLQQQTQPSVNNYIGEKGDSSYQLAVKQGFKGSLSDYLDSLHGKDSISTSTIKTIEKPTVIETTNTIVRTEVVQAPVTETEGKPTVEDVRTNSDTCDVEIKYSGSRGYQILVKASRLLGGCGIE